MTWGYYTVHSPFGTQSFSLNGTGREVPRGPGPCSREEIHNKESVITLLSIDSKGLLRVSWVGYRWVGNRTTVGHTNSDLSTFRFFLRLPLTLPWGMESFSRYSVPSVCTFTDSSRESSPCPEFVSSLKGLTTRSRLSLGFHTTRGKWDPELPSYWRGHFLAPSCQVRLTCLTRFPFPGLVLSRSGNFSYQEGSVWWGSSKSK